MSHTVVITGGSKGIGWELVQAYANEGFYVVSGSRTIRDDVPLTIANKVKQVVVDVKNKNDHYKLVDEAKKWGGSLDCYINNAGYSEWRAIGNIDEQFLTDIFETNLEKLPPDEQEVLRKSKRQGRSSWGVRRAARPVWFKRSAGIRTRVQSGAARMKRFHHSAGK